MFKNAAAEFVEVRTYAKWIEAKKKRETWPETIDRFIEFLLEERGTLIPSKVIRKIKNKMLAFEVMPSMRALWSAGLAAKSSNVTMYNCSFLVIDCVEAFAETLYILCCGTGLGFSVAQEHVSKLPTVNRLTLETNGLHVISDDKEGWADSVKILMNSLYEGKDIEFDYSKIRPAGSRLRTMGGRASGPEPLIALHRFIREIFSKAQGRKLTSLECHDLQNKIAEIVVVGGVRRSSQISLSDLEDILMRDSKLWPFPMHRAMANNSAIFTKKPSSAEFMKEWAALAASGTGERGIFNLEAARNNAPNRRKAELIQGTNPCQPSFAKLTKADGSQTTMGELKIGEALLNCEGKETIVLDKWSTGIQPVYAYGVVGGSFIGTSNHKVLVKDASTKNIYKLEIDIAFSHSNYLVSTEKYGWQNLDSKVYLGDYEVFDITVNDDTHTYTTNGVHVSNCGEVALRDQEFCNLSEVVVRPEDDLDSLLEKVETATWLGIIQSTFTNFPYLRKNWKINCEEERLLGVSLTGQMDNKELLTPSALKALKQKAIKVAKHASEKMGISMPAAITLGKPSGTVSQLVDSASGMHTRFATYYIRRYRISALDPLCKMLKAQGIKLFPENGQEVLSEDKVSTWVIEFPVKSPKNALTRNDISALEQLEWYKNIQINWCEHNQSCTVYVKEAEWVKVGNWVYENWGIVNGISFLPFDSGHYKQPPYQEISKEEYNQRIKEFKSIDYSKLSQFELEDMTQGSKELACAGGVCEL